MATDPIGEPGAFEAEVARRVRDAVVSEVPTHRGRWLIGASAAVLVASLIALFIR